MTVHLHSPIVSALLTRTWTCVIVSCVSQSSYVALDLRMYCGSGRVFEILGLVWENYFGWGSDMSYNT